MWKFAQKIRPILASKLLPWAFICKLWLTAQKFCPIRAIQLLPWAFICKLWLTTQKFCPIPAGQFFFQLLPRANFFEVRIGGKKFHPVWGSELILPEIFATTSIKFGRCPDGITPIFLRKGKRFFQNRSKFFCIFQQRCFLHQLPHGTLSQTVHLFSVIVAIEQVVFLQGIQSVGERLAVFEFQITEIFVPAVFKHFCVNGVRVHQRGKTQQIHDCFTQSQLLAYHIKGRFQQIHRIFRITIGFPPVFPVTVNGIIFLQFLQFFDECISVGVIFRHITCNDLHRPDVTMKQCNDLTYRIGFRIISDIGFFAERKLISADGAEQFKRLIHLQIADLHFLRFAVFGIN